MKKINLLSLLSVAITGLFISETVAQQASAIETQDVPVLVTRDLVDPQSNPIKDGDWVTATGSFRPCEAAPSAKELNPDAKGLHVEVGYAAQSFQYWRFASDVVIPGEVKEATIKTRKLSQAGWGGEISFFDATNKEYKVGLDASGPEWQTVDIKAKVGKNWDKIKWPLRFSSITLNNWGERNLPSNSTWIVEYSDLRIVTDVSGIPENERPWSIKMGFPAEANTFYYKEDKPSFTLSAQSYLGRRVMVDIEAIVEKIAEKPGDGRKLRLDVPQLSCDGTSMASITLPTADPGAYLLTVTAKGFPETKTFTNRYAVARRPRKLTEEEKKWSTYGINVHGGGYVGYEKFARLGFVWVRDYAYNFAWMNRARGEGAYKGWPWYPKIVKAAKDNGMLTLPCLMGAMGFYDPNGKPGQERTPSLEWRRDMARIIAAFPDMLCWELDNEKDSLRWGAHDVYGEAHRVFGQIMKAVAPDKWAVSEGAAGIYSDDDGTYVKDGSYKDIDVVNGHRYCGVDAPELSKNNANTGTGDAEKITLKDMWRTWKRNVCSDGKNRQIWVTECGWDTRAGQIVSEWQQAAYMQRQWVLAMGNGVDKLFWYWYYDSDTDTPKNFFDGCGIFDRFREPKPVAPAFAALRTFLPAGYKYLGYANLGPNHMAHMLDCDGRIVALAFKIDVKGKDLTIDDPVATEICDMFGAPLPAGKRELNIAPTWYIGLDPACPWLKQCPMEIESNFFVKNVSGESIAVHLRDVDKYEYSVKPPEGWTVEKKDYGFDVTGPKGLPRGNSHFVVSGVNDGVKKDMLVEVDIVPQAYAKSYAADFGGKFKVDVVNQSKDEQVFTIRANLPEGWKVEPAEWNTPKMDPNGKVTGAFTLLSSKAIPASEKVAIPKLEIVNDIGTVIDYSPVIPRAWEIHHIASDKVKFDGDVDEWTDKYQLPGWMLGPRGDKEKTRFWAAYNEEGIYLAFDIDDSMCETSDPNSFWRAADCLEFQFSAPGAKFEEFAPWTMDDHQFWFCPLLKENRVFAGFWGNCEGQQIASDIKDVKQAMRKTQSGYIMEIMIPKARLHSWEKAKRGETVGMAFTLAVRGHRDNREIYWPASKADQAVKRPWMWAKVKLGD